MSQTAMMVPHVTGIPGPAQAGSSLERAVSRVLGGKPALVLRRLIQAKRLPIAILLPIVEAQEEVSYE